MEMMCICVTFNGVEVVMMSTLPKLLRPWWNILSKHRWEGSGRWVRCLKTRVFICSWRKPQYPQQELCCCYYCLISLSLGGISGSLPGDGWNHPSLSYEFAWLSCSCCLCTAFLPPKVQLYTKLRGSSSGSAPPGSFCFNRSLSERHHFRWPAPLSRSRGKSCSNWYVFVVRGVKLACPVPHCHEYATCHKWQSAAMHRWYGKNWSTPLLWKQMVNKYTYCFPLQLNAAETQALTQRVCAIGKDWVLLTNKWSCRQSGTSSASTAYTVPNNCICISSCFCSQLTSSPCSR